MVDGSVADPVEERGRRLPRVVVIGGGGDEARGRGVLPETLDLPPALGAVYVVRVVVRELVPLGLDANRVDALLRRAPAIDPVLVDEAYESVLRRVLLLLLLAPIISSPRPACLRFSAPPEFVPDSYRHPRLLQVLQYLVVELDHGTPSERNFLGRYGGYRVEVRPRIFLLVGAITASVAVVRVQGERHGVEARVAAPCQSLKYRRQVIELLVVEIGGIPPVIFVVVEWHRLDGWRCDWFGHRIYHLVEVSTSNCGQNGVLCWIAYF